MTLTQYEAFLKTVELGSLTRAAMELDYTQSGITHMLNALEQDCGMQLLIRDRTGVRLTADGELLLPYVQEVCNSQRRFSDQLKSMRNLESGLVRIGTFASVSAQWLPGMLRSFRNDYPGIDFELLHGTNKENEAWTMSGRVDLSFIKLPAVQPLKTIFLHRDPLVAVLPQEHLCAGKEPFPIGDLPNYAYIHLNDGTENEIDELLKHYRVYPKVHFSEVDDYAILAMVENGLGISILPKLVLERTSRQIVSVPLDVPAYRDLGIAVCEKQPLSAAAKRFLQYAQDWICANYPKN